MKRILRIGTRGSQLALWQSNWVKQSLISNMPSLQVELVLIKTKGDKILDVPLAKVGGKGLFVKEIEEALLRKEIDLAVHSLKDMPGEIPAGLCIGAIPEREDPRDVVISKSGAGLQDLPTGAVIGTSSLRRMAQIRRFRPDLQIMPLRGNLDTRLAKLASESFSAIILAAAGIRRMGLEYRVAEYLDPEIVLPAVGQGALCLEIREQDDEITAQVRQLDHAPTRQTVLGERAFLRKLEGGCQVPLAAYGTLTRSQYHLTGMIADLEGKRFIRESLSGSQAETESIGIKLAEQLIEKGARQILEELTIMSTTTTLKG